MSNPGPLTTHVLDTAKGAPAVGVPILLEKRGDDGSFLELARGITNSDGRCPGLLPVGALEIATYRLTFDIAAYEADGPQGFYPYAQIVFRVREPAQHHHVPLLLSPFGYSTYRGS
ncbi:MAG: hydroxyisourate hydrolase [Myxococcota bacterium]